jgi:hypothetical protein
MGIYGVCFCSVTNNETLPTLLGDNFILSLPAVSHYKLQGSEGDFGRTG